MNVARTVLARALVAAAHTLTVAAYLGIALVLLATIAPDGVPRFDGPLWGAAVLCLALLGVDRLAVHMLAAGARITRMH